MGAKTIALAVGGALLVAAMAFGAGFFVGASRTREVEQALAAERRDAERQLAKQSAGFDGELEKTRSAATTERERLSTRLEGLEGRLMKLEARRELGRVLLQLDDRNFGIAQEHLEAATRLLAKVDDEPARALAKSLGETKVVVAGNLLQQRVRVRELVNDLDRIIDAEGGAGER